MTEIEMSKSEKAIAKLIEYTQDGNLEWKIVNPNSYLPKIDIKDAMLFVRYDDKPLLLFRQGYKHKSVQSFISSQFASEKEEIIYRAVLCVFDTSSKTAVYYFPYSTLVEDLYKAAVYNAAKVDDLIDSLLKRKLPPKK